MNTCPRYCEAPLRSLAFATTVSYNPRSEMRSARADDEPAPAALDNGGVVSRDGDGPPGQRRLRCLLDSTVVDAKVKRPDSFGSRQASNEHFSLTPTPGE